MRLDKNVIESNVKSALYLCLTVDKQEVESNKFIAHTIMECASPRWDYKVTFDVTDIQSDLVVSIYDDAGVYVLSGRMAIPLFELQQEGGRKEGWFELRTLKGDKEKPFGEIWMTLSLKDSKKKKVSLEDFEQICTIGKGSFGKVIQVRKKDTGRIYAMKILRKSDLIARQEVEHTRSEQHILRLMRHQFVVGLKYSFQTDDRLFMVMDFINGGELFWHLKHDGKFDEIRTRFYACEIILALEHIHLLDTVYRDLKPENILLDSEGHVLLTDFGLCKEGLSEGETTNTFCGTAEYLAPEVLEGRGYGKAVDWWSLGTLIFEMLTGYTPYYSNNTNSMYQKILTADFKCPDYISRDAKLLIKALLTKNPSERLGGDVTDAEEVKAHSFFASVDWQKVALKQLPVPFKPTVRDKSDTTNIDPEFLNESVDNSLPSVPMKLGSNDQVQFRGFTFQEEGGLQSVRNGVLDFK